MDFFKLTPLNEAQDLWMSTLKERGIFEKIGSETIPTVDSLGRVTAEPVFAKMSSPPYNCAAMDGFCVKSDDTKEAKPTKPVRLKIQKEALRINTGEVLPEGFDAIVMLEDVNQTEDEIELYSSCVPYQNVRLVGEDVVETEFLLPENHLIRPSDLGILLACGVFNVKVKKTPRVAIIPTGSEIIPPGKIPQDGQVIDSNSYVLAGMCKIEGAFPEIYQPIADDLQLISKTLRDASFSSDLVLLIAGTSMGQKDFVKEAVRCEGEVILHGVAIKPGRPVLLGVVNEKPVLGLPGFPVACMLNFELFGIPVIRGYLSIPPKRLTKIKATFARSVPSSSSAEEFLRVRVAKVGQRFIATPLQRGSGIFSSLVKADGIVRIPYLSEGISVGQEHEVLLLRDLEEITNTIVVIGSCDHTIDLLANMLHKKFPFLYLSSANVGSMGGLMALKRREAHVAGCHLLDEKTGEYNIPFIKNMLEDLKVCVVNLVHRIQGFIVAPGNPKGIKDLKDLSRSDVRFINRQRGSGTRLLLDYNLKKYKIPPESINGYTQEEFTHISVASKVSKGIADVGLGILAAARALKLDFIPLTEERFDLVIPQSYLDSNPIKCLLQIIRSFPFKNKVEDLGGYNTKDTGKVLYSS